MSIEFQCHSCGRRLRVPEGSGGKTCVCPGCQTQLDIPSATVEEEAISVLYETVCPNCQHVLMYTAELEGTRGLCKACNHIFTIAQDPTVSTGATESTNSFPFHCPRCRKLFEGQRGMEGRKGKCDQCRHVFIIHPFSNAGDGAHGSPSLPKAIPKPQASNAMRDASQGRIDRDSIKPISNRSSPAASSARPVSVPGSEATSASPASDPNSVWQVISAALPQRNVVAADAPVEPFVDPYQPPTMQVSARPRYPDLFQHAFRLGTEGLWNATLWMFVISLVASLCMMPVALLLGGFLAVFGESMQVRSWNGYTLGLFVLIGTIPMIAIWIYFLPAFWNIAHRQIARKQQSFSQAIEKSHLASRFLLWSLLMAVASLLAIGMATVFFFPILYLATTTRSNPIILLTVFLQYMSTMLIALLAASPWMLAPFAWLDGQSFTTSLGTSFKMIRRHPVVFAALTIVAYALGAIITILSFGIANMFLLSLVLMVQAAYYKLVKDRYGLG